MRDVPWESHTRAWHPERVRPLRYSINVSLDGCVDHLSGTPDEESHNHAAQTIARADAIILGRTTYELMEFWRRREPAAVDAALPHRDQ